MRSKPTVLTYRVTIPRPVGGPLVFIENFCVPVLLIKKYVGEVCFCNPLDVELEIL